LEQNRGDLVLEQRLITKRKDEKAAWILTAIVTIY
jgi:hypothetical protein